MAVRRPRHAQAAAGVVDQLPASMTIGRSRGWNYVLAMLGVAAVTVVRAAIDPYVGTADPALTIFVYLVGVGIAGTLRGVECALVSLFLGGAAAWFLYLGPQPGMTLLDPVVLVGIALYVQTGVGIAFLTGGQHRAHVQARAAAAEAAARAAELNAERAARERAEIALRRLDERAAAGAGALARSALAMQLAHEAAGLGTWDHDLATGAMEWDARAKALFGLTPDVAMTHAMWAAAVHPPDLPNAEALQELSLRERKPFSAEYRIRWPDGSVHWITAVGRASFDPASGKPVRLTGVMLDGTDRKKEEERLSEVLRLEAIGRLAGGVAHDLNNMLVAILGYSELLGRTLDIDDPRRRDVDQITEAATRSAKLTRQLLAFARRELIQPQRLELNQVVERSEASLRSVLGSNIELALQLSPAAGVIYADPSQVEQVIMNLVLNARDAMPDGGWITIETGPGPDRHVMLAVHDNGHGMDPTTLRRIWEPFFTTKPAGRGAGLGLAAVHGAVKQSGGFVGAESEPNRGTVVSVYWPEVQIEPAAA